MQQFVVSLQEEQRVNNAKIVELQAKAQNEAANAQTEVVYAQVAMVNAQIADMKRQNEHINTRIEQMLAAAKIQSDHHIGMQGARTSQSSKK